MAELNHTFVEGFQKEENEIETFDNKDFNFRCEKCERVFPKKQAKALHLNKAHNITQKQTKKLWNYQKLRRDHTTVLTVLNVILHLTLNTIWENILKINIKVKHCLQKEKLPK